MIYRKNPKFIFVHVPRTGGTSVESALSEILLSKPLEQVSVEEANQYLLPAQDTVHQHFSLSNYEMHFDPDLREFFVFGFVRNPWDLVVSEIEFFKKHEGITFNQRRFSGNVRKLISMSGGNLWGHNFMPQSYFLKDRKGRINVDFIGRFENLQKDYEYVCEHLKLPPHPLPWKLQASETRRHYAELYDSETKALVASHYREDVLRFNYSFDG